MTEPSEHAVEVLNGLIETTLDSARGYEQAGDLARNPRFKNLFQERAEARRHLMQELKDEVHSIGGQSADGGSILGQAHRVFVELRDKIAGRSDKAIVEEVERGENFVRDRFEKAVQDGALPPQAHQLVERAYGAIAADRDETSAWKAEFH